MKKLLRAFFGFVYLTAVLFSCLHSSNQDLQFFLRNSPSKLNISPRKIMFLNINSDLMMLFLILIACCCLKTRIC